MSHTQRYNAIPISNLDRLPAYAFIYTIKNLGEFRVPFWVLTALNIISAILTFWGVWLLSRVLSEITTLSLDQIFTTYVPLFFCAYIGKEICDYFTRRFGEGMSSMFADVTQARFFASLVASDPALLVNAGKERLLSLTGRYVSHVQAFLADWFWGCSRKIIQALLVACILIAQSPFIAAVAFVYFAIFLAFSFRISRAYAPYASKLAQASLASSSLYTQFMLGASTVQRLNILSWSVDQLRTSFISRWETLARTQEFHARRWLIQLNAFNFLYLGSLIFGVYQVKIGALSLGFLLLIRYAFERLWDIMAYVIEYYVSLVQQREEIVLIRDELSRLRATPSAQAEVSGLEELAIRDGRIDFVDSTSKNGFSLTIPNFTLRAGSRVGILGASGSGKSAFLHGIMGLAPLQGDVSLNGRRITSKRIPSALFCYINNSDPLFKVSLRENMVLGRKVSPERLEQLLSGLHINSFLRNLDAVVGDTQFNLSAGQEQRIRIARGLLQVSPVYIFDEAFNGIDQDTKMQILDFLKTFIGNSALILATHSEQELRLVDTIYRIEAGSLVKQEIAT